MVHAAPRRGVHGRGAAVALASVRGLGSRELHLLLLEELLLVDLHLLWRHERYRSVWLEGELLLLEHHLLVEWVRLERKCTSGFSVLRT